MTVNARQLIDALQHRYANIQGESSISADELVSFIRSIPETEIPADGNLISLIQKANPDWQLGAAEQTVLASSRDCLTLIFNLINLAPEIQQRILTTTPIVAAELMHNPALPLQDDAINIFTVLDQLLDATIGWSSDQGRAGEKVLAQVTAAATALRAEPADYVALNTALNNYLDKERSRVQKLEERLAASESGKLRSQKSRGMAAALINSAAEGKKLTASIIGFLIGPWFESLQLLAINCGVEGEEWSRATKLTETIIWTYQPINADSSEQAKAEKQRLYRILEHLTDEIRDMLLALEHSADNLEAALADLEEDHVLMVSDRDLDYVEYLPIDTPGSGSGSRPSVSRILLRKVSSLEPGQWFIYTEGEKSARIKLALKLEDVRQILFTNRNGMKALDRSYDEIAYLMSSGVLRPLNHQAVFSDTFRNFYQGLLDELERKQKLVAEANREEAEREATRQKALQEAAALARANEEAEHQRREEARQQRLEKAQEAAARAENQERVAQIAELVDKLQIGAWLKLPAADGTLEDCKLAVRIASADKMIFVSRAGVKIGEYSAEQLTMLLVAGDGEIGDTGVEFEDTLAQVVSKLRADREKSYDDLTGSE